LPFDSSDPRTALAPEPVSIPTDFAEPQLIRFRDADAEISPAGGRQWVVRTQHAVVTFAIAVGGDSWSDRGETLLAVPDKSARVRVSCDGNSRMLTGPSVAVVPDKESVIEILDGGIVVRVVPSVGSDLLGDCINAAAYAQPAANVATYSPVCADHELLSYRISDYPAAKGRFGHIFQSTNLMVNFIATRIGPRDPHQLSPHSHIDFEQCSIQLAGEFVHHVRTPWIPNKVQWQPDRHLELAGPGAVIFPPPLEHTSEAIGADANSLIDVFAPPREDFLSLDGWVLNRDDFA
jgi:hypothetical protein